MRSSLYSDLVREAYPLVNEKFLKESLLQLATFQAHFDVKKPKNSLLDLDSQIIAQNKVVAKLEKSIIKLQEETEKLNDQCKTNTEVSSR